jgi:hypothetical protein
MFISTYYPLLQHPMSRLNEHDSKQLLRLHRPGPGKKQLGELSCQSCYAALDVSKESIADIGSMGAGEQYRDRKHSYLSVSLNSTHSQLVPAAWGYQPLLLSIWPPINGRRAANTVSEKVQAVQHSCHTGKFKHAYTLKNSSSPSAHREKPPPLPP